MNLYKMNCNCVVGDGAIKTKVSVYITTSYEPILAHVWANRGHEPVYHHTVPKLKGRALSLKA